MKKVLVIANSEKISPNANGGAAVVYSHVQLLSSLGYEVILLVAVWNDRYEFKKEDYVEVTSFVSEIIPYEVDKGKRKRRLNWLYFAAFKPTEFEYFFINQNNIQYLQNIVDQKSIDLVWCEWRWAAIWTMETPLKVPKIYSHHDWEYKLSLLREKPSLNTRFHSFQKKRVEIKLVRHMNACVSGSMTETQEIEQISKKKALYLPTTYLSISSTLNVKEQPSIVHLGGMGTTANRIGLERFLDVCWTEIKSAVPNVELVVVGSITRAQESLKEKLQDQQIRTLGFVKDLETVLHPNDIHIVPWEYNTGTRTRIPVVLNHKQALVSTKESVRCYPEITDENAVLCKDLEDMKDSIIHLYSDLDKVHLLATKGKKTFEENFTFSSQKERLKQFLKQIL